jgi:hypothetical protein
MMFDARNKTPPRNTRYYQDTRGFLLTLETRPRHVTQDTIKTQEAFFDARNKTPFSLHKRHMKKSLGLRV